MLDNGVNLIDTARAYKGEIAPGIMLESEKIVGEVVRQRTDLTDPLVIVTKGHAYTIPGYGEGSGHQPEIAGHYRQGHR